MGDVPWSEGLRLVLERLAEELPGRDLLVAEHGVGTDDDDWREEILKGSLRHVEEAVDGGIPVKGFFHWTAVDNYEWLHGYEVQFGLFDRERNPKPASASLLKRWATEHR
jgi:beta-glucosidase